MNWRVKGAIQKALGYLPGGGRLHYMLQRRVGGMTDFGRECDIKVDDWRLMMGHLRSAKVDLASSIFLEMGSGWYPTFPLAFYLAGVPKVYTLDLNRLMKRDMTKLLADRLEAHVPLIAREAGLPAADVSAKQRALAGALERGASLAHATASVVDYRAPADAADTAFGAGAVDVVFSNSVLEHVPGPVIADCFAEAMRILRPGGIMLHSVNCGDHYAYTDRSIDQLNYLQFTDDEWNLWNNAFLYQNRLRAKDFITMAKDAGFTIEIDTSTPSPKRLAQIDTMRIAPTFAGYSREELAVTSVDFVARKPAAA